MTALRPTRPHRDLCPEADERDAMTDDEFWAHVYRIDPVYDVDPDDEPGDTDDVSCAECGEFGACAYDAEGRPLIHPHAGRGRE